jgi:hypothetical protein
MMTPQEAQTLKAIEAAKARGEDIFGDDEEIVAAGYEQPGPGDEDADDSSVTNEQGAKKEADGAEEGADEQTTEAMEQDGQNDDQDPVDPAVLDKIDNPKAEQDTQPPAYKAAVPEDYKTKRAELLKAKAEVTKLLMDGEIDAEQFAKAEAEILDMMEDLTAQRIRAETLIEANVQTQQAYQHREVQRLIARTKSEVDYAADPKAVKQFDTAMAILSSDPDNAGKDFAELIQDAHTMVATMRGISSVKAAPVAKNVQPPERKPTDPAPVTLRSLPSAATPNSNGSLLDQLSRLKGPDYERAFAKLSPADRRALLDETEDA